MTGLRDWHVTERWRGWRIKAGFWIWIWNWSPFWFHFPKERHHGVVFDGGSLKAAAAWAARHLPERRLPDKAKQCRALKCGLYDLYCWVMKSLKSWDSPCSKTSWQTWSKDHYWSCRTSWDRTCWLQAIDVVDRAAVLAKTRTSSNSQVHKCGDFANKGVLQMATCSFVVFHRTFCMITSNISGVGVACWCSMM